MGRAGGAGERRTIGVGMLGYAFMGKAHANAYRKIAYMTWPPPLRPRLVAIAGRTEDAVAEAARRYGFEGYATDWRELVANDAIQLFDNSGPNNLHAEPSIAAAEAGKHVDLREAARAHGRREPRGLAARRGDGREAHVRLQLPLRPGRAARARAARGRRAGRDLPLPRRATSRSGATSTTRSGGSTASAAGSGALGDLGAHVIDLARYLVGEIASVSGATRTFKEGRDVDDAFESVVEFENGAVGTLEASRFCPGRKNAFAWEINGSKGSIAFDLERLNELQVHLSDSTPGERAQGFRSVLVSEADHPFWEHWWPHGHIIGWEHSFVHELHHLLTRDRRGRRRCAARGHVRGRLSSRRGLRRDRALERVGPAGGDRVSLTRA